MFTGIVDHCGEIHSIQSLPTGMILHINSRFSDLQLGESIAVDGVCLTVAEEKDGIFSCDLSFETLARTRAYHYKVHDLVNLERPLRLSDRMGGHLVLGHVDETIILSQRENQGNAIKMVFEGLSDSAQAYLIYKGSVAINGVSLTVNEITRSSFSVMLIPHTLGRTNLNNLIPGQSVNIEWDTVVKIIVKTAREVLSHVHKI